MPLPPPSRYALPVSGLCLSSAPCPSRETASSREQGLRFPLPMGEVAVRARRAQLDPTAAHPSNLSLRLGGLDAGLQRCRQRLGSGVLLEMRDVAAVRPHQI